MNYQQIIGQLTTNSVNDYLTAAGAFCVTLLILIIVERLIIRRISVWTSNSESQYDDIVADILSVASWPLYVIIGLNISVHFLILSNLTQQILNWAFLIGGTWYVIRIGTKFIDYGIKILLSKSDKEQRERNMMQGLLTTTLKIAIWLLAIAFILQNMGFKISAILGGLGVGGIAIAFALNAVLADIFSYISIYFDRPFKEGDFIAIGQDKGTVEKIGIKTTRIRTLLGDEMVVSNQDLTSARLNNYKQIQRRRVAFTFGVIYETPLPKLKKIPEMVEKLFKDKELVDFGRVHFTELGDFSLNFEVVYYMNTNSYTQYLDSQQRINYDLMQSFAKQKIEFAYPTQVVYTKK